MTVRIRPAVGSGLAIADLSRQVEEGFETARRLDRYTVATLPDAVSLRGVMIIVTDESGGEIPAWSDGTNWRRVSDRAIVS